MRSLHKAFLLAIWCTCITVIQRTDTFLFRRAKPFHQLVNDPYQVKPQKLTVDNMMKWFNMKSHIKFKLWTRKNPRWAQEIVIDDVETLQSSNFDKKRLTKILVHGWAHSANEVSMEDWLLALRDAYLRLADLNIIFIDYTMFALPFMYFSAAPELAAHRLSELIEFLVKNGVEYSHIHLLGYSWGAHVAGIAGYKLNGSLARITGLDPANPTFRLVDNILRLDASDAQFVDIIHTGGGPFTGGYLGLEYSLGHADYFPNGGTVQPGCAFHFLHLDEGIECDHGRAVWYFVESINSPYAFPGCKCESWNSFVKGFCSCSQDETTLMGEFTPHKTRGNFYLFTRSSSPFGMGSRMNLTLQNMDEYDSEWNKYDHMNHNFTSKSATQYLTKVVQKSLQRMPPPYLPYLKNPRKNSTQYFKAYLLQSAKNNSQALKDSIRRRIRQSELSKSIGANIQEQ